MATPEYFERFPPFSTDAPVAVLPEVSLAGLQAGEEQDIDRLYDACREWGFFLLDFTNAKGGEALVRGADQMFDLTSETFALDQPTLDSYACKPPHDLTGYKHKGMLKTEDGKRDWIEVYTISQDDMFENGPSRENVGTVEAKRTVVKEFMQHCHAVATTILHQLDGKLGLEPGTLESLNPADQESKSSLRLLHSQQQSTPEYDRIAFGGHTDIGTITLLFNIIGGLQILPAGSENKNENWLYLKPKPGCAIVNIGDTIVEWTGGVLRSALHRVITAPGSQAKLPRQSIAYLIGPRETASMGRLKGGLIPPLENGDTDETRSVSEWAAWRAQQIMLGQLKPETRGGVKGALPVPMAV